MAGELVTERPKRFQKVDKSPDGLVVYTGVRTFDISEAADESAALAALLSQKSVQIGSPHPQMPSAVCNNLQPERLTPTFYTITAGYSSSEPNAQLLLEPPFVKCDPYEYTVLSDFDADGVPNVNTAHLPYERQIPLDKTGLLFTFSRWESFYDVQRSLTFGGKVNADPMNLFGYTAAVGQVKCKGIFQGEQRTDSSIVRVSYVFDIREEGHTYDVADVGAVGWCQIGAVYTTGKFVAGKNGAAMGQIRLNGNGFPLASGVYVAPPFQEGKANSGPETTSPSVLLINQRLSTADLYVLSFARAKKVALAGLALSL